MIADVSGGRGGGTGRTVGGRGTGVNCIGGAQFSSRRSSEDSTTDETLPTNVREMRVSTDIQFMVLLICKVMVFSVYSSTTIFQLQYITSRGLAKCKLNLDMENWK